jgi:hypothetical protein
MTFKPDPGTNDVPPGRFLGVVVANSSQASIFQQVNLIERMAFDLADLGQDAILLTGARSGDDQ